MLDQNLAIRYQVSKIGKLVFNHLAGHETRPTVIMAPEASRLIGMSELNRALVAMRSNYFKEVNASEIGKHLDDKHPVLIAAAVSGINEWAFFMGDIQYLSSEWYLYNIPTDNLNPLSQLRNGYVDADQAGMMIHLRYFVEECFC